MGYPEIYLQKYWKRPLIGLASKIYIDDVEFDLATLQINLRCFQKGIEHERGCLYQKTYRPGFFKYNRRNKS